MEGKVYWMRSFFSTPSPSQTSVAPPERVLLEGRVFPEQNERDFVFDCRAERSSEEREFGEFSDVTEFEE
jgi:hypothetical protein